MGHTLQPILDPLTPPPKVFRYIALNIEQIFVYLKSDFRKCLANKLKLVSLDSPIGIAVN